MKIPTLMKEAQHRLHLDEAATTNKYQLAACPILLNTRESKKSVTLTTL